MHTTISSRRLLAALTACAAVTVNCGLDKQSAPPLAGPSEFGTSITLTATPDTLLQDGTSHASIRAVVRDASGEPVRGLQIMFAGTSNSARVPDPFFTAASVATDANGVAQTELIAPEVPPSAPAPDPLVDPVITVTATPVGGNFANQTPRTVLVRIIPPADTPRTNGPDAIIVTSRQTVLRGESVTFDGSFSTYNGMPCGTHCDYIWSVTGPTIDDETYLESPFRAIKFERKFEAPGTYTATLIVTDEHGYVDSASRSVVVLANASTNK
jgi:hypothetical protein